MSKRELIRKYKHQLTIKNYSDSTIQSYINGLHKYICYLKSRKITVANELTIFDFLMWCKKKENYGYSSMKQMVASLRFLYEEVLRKEIDFNFDISMKKLSRIPVVLSVQEVERFLKSFNNLKHKAIFTLLYLAGLRIGELLNLKISDIDSDRMQIRIDQGKGQKDRYSILSEKVLEILREYVKEYQPKTYLFEGQSGGPYSSSSIQALMRKHKKLCKITKKATPHTLRLSFAYPVKN